MQPAVLVVAQHLGGLGIDGGIYRRTGCGETPRAQGWRQGAERLKALEIVCIIKMQKVCLKLLAPRCDRPARVGIKPIILTENRGAGKASGLQAVSVAQNKGQLSVAVDMGLAALPIHKTVKIAFVVPDDVLAVMDLFAALSAPLA